MSRSWPDPILTTMNTPSTGGHLRPRSRTIVGFGLALVGVYALFGGLFAPPTAVLRDPDPIPMPERLVAIWLILLGLAVAFWPRESRGTDR
jgi:hypothetical protein